jgi:sugar/nucleoside kinase (ribokinase family)
MRIRAPKMNIVDFTGSADVFDAAFLAAYLRTGEVIGAGRFGTSAAVLSVMGFDTTVVPSTDPVNRVLRSQIRR